MVKLATFILTVCLAYATLVQKHVQVEGKAVLVCSLTTACQVSTAMMDSALTGRLTDPMAILAAFMQTVSLVYAIQTPKSAQVEMKAARVNTRATARGDITVLIKSVTMDPMAMAATFMVIAFQTSVTLAPKSAPVELKAASVESRSTARWDFIAPIKSVTMEVPEIDAPGTTSANLETARLLVARNARRHG